MTAIYVFIATETTNERAIPTNETSQAEFNRKVALGFRDLSGGTTYVGDLKFRPTQDAIPKHLLCDGTVLQRDSFPQLFTYLRNTFGGDGVTTFALPDYSSQAITVPAITVTQEIDSGGTVTTGGTVTSPETPAQTGGTSGGNVPSGGRPNRLTTEQQLEQ